MDTRPTSEQRELESAATRLAERLGPSTVGEAVLTTIDFALAAEYESFNSADLRKTLDRALSKS